MGKSSGGMTQQAQPQMGRATGFMPTQTPVQTQYGFNNPGMQQALSGLFGQQSTQMQNPDGSINQSNIGATLAGMPTGFQGGQTIMNPIHGQHALRMAQMGQPGVGGQVRPQMWPSGGYRPQSPFGW